MKEVQMNIFDFVLKKPEPYECFRSVDGEFYYITTIWEKGGWDPETNSKKIDLVLYTKKKIDVTKPYSPYVMELDEFMQKLENGEIYRVE